MKLHNSCNGTRLELELLVFAFVRSLRTGDFDLYVDTLTK